MFDEQLAIPRASVLHTTIAVMEQARLRLVTERGEARRRLGSDLHDRIGHQLAATTRQVERASHLVGDIHDHALGVVSGSRRIDRGRTSRQPGCV